MSSMFEFRDEKDAIVTSVTLADINKKLPQGFELKRPQTKKKGAKPCVLLYVTLLLYYCERKCF